MRHCLPAVLVAAFLGSPMPLIAQEARPAQTDSDTPTHGIIRKARPRTAQPVKQAPVATTEEAAAAIAAAVRSAEETRKPKPAPQRPSAPKVESRAALRRYEVRWPSQRLEVEWDAPDGVGVTLSWQDVEAPAQPGPDERGPQP